MTDSIVGQPAAGTVTFMDASDALVDPFSVVLSSVSPLGQTIAYTVGVSPQATRLSLGTFQLAFTPTAPGGWLVIGDGFDSDGNQTGSGISPALTIGPRRGGTEAQIQAQSIVEEYIGPLALQTETVRLYSGADGVLQLPRRNALTVTSVLASFDFYEDTAPTSALAPTPTADSAGLISDPLLLAYTWYDVVYTHGWADAAVPQIIQTVLAAVAARIAANPDGVSSERIGTGYGVSYATVSPAWLTDDEKKALTRFRKGRATTLTTSTPIGGTW
jgi:hypothetical protein